MHLVVVGCSIGQGVSHVGPDFDLARVVEVMTVLEGDPGFGYGSGYLVAHDLVLTARHVLDGEMAVEVRFGARPGRPVRGCSVVWQGESSATDLALLKLHQPIEGEVEPVHFGDVSQIAGGRAP